jgi:hypothetical protein
MQNFHSELSTLTGNYLENRNADANKQIECDGPALVSIRGHRSFCRSGPVEAAIYAK